MIYEELAAKALERQRERDHWRHLAEGWKRIALGRSEVIKQYEEIVQKALTPR